MSAHTPDETQQLTATERAERQRAVVQALGWVLPADAILYTPEDTTPYECDGLTAYRERRCRPCSKPATPWRCLWWHAARARVCRAAPCRTAWA